MPLTCQIPMILAAEGRTTEIRGFVARGVIRGTDYLIETSLTGDRVRISRRGPGRLRTLAEKKAGTGSVRGVGGSSTVGSRSLIWLDSYLYLFESASTRPRLTPVGGVASLPRRVADVWVGSFYSPTGELRVCILGARGFLTAPAPRGLEGVTTLRNAPLYEFSGPSGERLIVGRSAPTVSSGALHLGRTVPAFGPRTLDSHKCKVGVEVGSSSFYVCRDKLPGKQLCSVSLCRVGPGSIEHLAMIFRECEWPGKEDMDEAVVIQHRALLLIRTGLVTRSLLLVDLRTLRAKVLSRDSEPSSPSVSVDSAVGCLREPRVLGAVSPGRSETTRPVMYELTGAGIRIGGLPARWNGCVGLGRAGVLLVGVRAKGTPVYRHLPRIPPLKGGRWIVRSP